MQLNNINIITDVKSEENRELLQRVLSRHGCAAEHNYYCYLYTMDKSEKPYVAVFEDDMAIFAKKDTNDNSIRVFTEILAPSEKKPEVLKNFLNHLYENADKEKPKKVWLELTPDTRKSVLKELDNTNYKINKINYTLIWPIFEMDKWNGESMAGGEWKDIRYYWNRFFRDHKVEFVSADKVPKEDLKKLVLEWKESRTTGDKAYTDYYMNAIDTNFEGYDHNWVMLVDGKVAALTAGFKSNTGYYSSVGLYSKSIDRSNEIANMYDLINLKKLGYSLVDFGGVEKKSLEFKKKFKPTGFYKTHVFSIVRKN